MSDSENIGQVVDQLEKTILLREPLKTGGWEERDGDIVSGWTDTITGPYKDGNGRCEDCEDYEKIKSNSKIALYDLVGLAKIVKKYKFIQIMRPDKKKLKNFAPYLEIIACKDHLKEALKECFLGTYRYKERGKDPLKTGAYDQLLIHLKGPDELSEVIVSYPIHPQLAKKAMFLERHFIALKPY